MNIFQAGLLGVVQGLTEFLPISSSGHLILVPWLFGWKDPGLTFSAALHLGTLFAILAFFWKDWAQLIKRWKQPLLWLILIGCLPAAAAGYKFEELFDTVFRSPLIIASLMIGMGLLLWIAEFVSRKYRNLDEVNLSDSLFIGFAQILALMPGVSRSGITMTAGLFAGLKREAATRFSFLLATPIILGAGVFKLRHVIAHGVPGGEGRAFLVGVIVSAIVGFLAIKYLLQYLQKHTFYVFVWYRLVFGALIFTMFFLRG